MTRPITFVTFCVALVAAAVLHGGGPSVTINTDSAGNELSVTWHSADGRFSLMIEDLAATLPTVRREGDDPSNNLLATVLSGDQENQKDLWRTTFAGQLLECAEPDRVFLSPKADYFVVVPMLSSGVSLFRVFTEKGTTTIDLPPDDDEQAREWIAETETIGKTDVLRIWDQKNDRWMAFTLPDGNKFEATPTLTARWNEATRRKIRNALKRQARSELRDRLIGAAPALQKLTVLAPAQNPDFLLGEIHYEFLLRRRNPEDRKFFENMLRNCQGGLRGSLGVGFSCGFGRQWQQSYEFSSADYERERADTLLARWDGKVKSDAEGGSETPYLLANLSGIVKLSAPILSNPGTIHIHLIPSGRQNGRWTNDANAGYLECRLPGPDPEQGDLADEIHFWFHSVIPGKYFIKTVWDKRSPWTDVTKAGPGDYETPIVGPIALQAGDVITNVVISCTNRVAGGEAYYAADAAAFKAWKITGDLSPSSFAPPNGEFSKPAAEWILKTNQCSFTNLQLIRIAVGETSVQAAGPFQQQIIAAPALKVYFAGTDPPDDLRQYEFAIIDEHGCRFNASRAYGPLGLAPAVFPRFPRSAKTFRLAVFEDINSSPIWDVTLRNLALTNAVAVEGESLPARKDLGPVTLKIENVTFSKYLEEGFGVDCTFHDTAGVKLEGWDFVDSELVDEIGLSLGDYGFCRNERSLRLKGAAVRNVLAAPEKWPIALAAFPSAGEFLPLNQETNLCGLRFTVVGLIGAGRTKFRLPDFTANDSFSMTSGDDFQLDVTSRNAKVESARPMLVLLTPAEGSRDVVFYVRWNGGDADDYVPGEDIEFGLNRLFLVPLNGLIESGASELEIRADAKIPVDLSIAMPKDLDTPTTRASAD